MLGVIDTLVQNAVSKGEFGAYVNFYNPNKSNEEKAKAYLYSLGFAVENASGDAFWVRW